MMSIAALSHNLNTRKLLITTWIVFSLALAIFLLRDVLFVPGLPYTRDLIFPYHLNFTYSHLLFTWDDINLQQNLEVNKIPFFLTSSIFSGIVGSEIAVKMLFVIVLFSINFFMFISLYILFRDNVRSTLRLAAICCIPSLFYLLNPVVVDRISNHIFMVFGMALNPLVLILFIRVLERGAGLGHLILVATVLTIMSIFSTHNIFYIVPILLFCFFFYILFSRTINKKKATLATTYIMCIYMLLNSYWILPTLHQFSTETIGPSYSLSVDSIARLSTENSPINVFGLIGGGAWNPVLQYPENITQLSIFLSYLIPFFSLLAIIFFHTNRFVILLTILFIFLYFFALGTNSPLPVYQWLLDAPILSGILWLFRDPSRLLIYIALVYSVLLAFALQKILYARYKDKTKITIIALILSGIIISPAALTFVNSGGNRLVSSQIPIEYGQLYNFLASDVGEYNVLWLPFRQYFNYDWNRIDDDVAGNFYVTSSQKPTIGISTQSSRNVLEFWQYIYREILLDYRSNELGKFLNLYGIKYLVVHDDLFGAQEREAKRILQILSSQKDIEPQKHIGPYYIFKNLEYDPRSDNFFAMSADDYSKYLSWPLVPSNSSHNISIDDIPKWDLPSSNVLSRTNINGTNLLLWKPVLPNNVTKDSEIKIHLPDANIRNFEKMKLDIFPAVNNSGDSLYAIIYSNTSKLTFARQNLFLGQWNEEVFNIVFKKISSIGNSSMPNLLNVTDIGLKVFNRHYEGLENYFLIKNISFIQDSENGMYDSNTILDKWTQRRINQNVISDISKIDATKYKLRINATEPYTLGFVQSYSPLWVAKVKEDGQRTFEFNSFPIYSGINGFEIDKLGQYEIEIDYKPQKWLLVGTYISISTVIGLLGYILFLVFPRLKANLQKVLRR